MRCPDCRKKEIELTTRWERFRWWMFKTLFADEYADLGQERFTQGFGDGYKEGFKRAEELNKKPPSVMMSSTSGIIEQMPHG